MTSQITLTSLHIAQTSPCCQPDVMSASSTSAAHVTVTHKDRATRTDLTGRRDGPSGLPV